MDGLFRLLSAAIGISNGWPNWIFLISDPLGVSNTSCSETEFSNCLDGIFYASAMNSPQRGNSIISLLDRILSIHYYRGAARSATNVYQRNLRFRTYEVSLKASLPSGVSSRCDPTRKRSFQYPIRKFYTRSKNKVIELGSYATR